MPTTQKPQQKHTKATQKVGGSAKKPVTKVVGGGSAKKPAATKVVGGGKAAPSKGKTTRGGSAKGGLPWNNLSTKNAEDIIELNAKISNIETNVIPQLVKLIEYIYEIKPDSFPDSVKTDFETTINTFKKRKYPKNNVIHENSQ